MNDLSSKSLFNLEKKEIDKIKKDFEAVKVTDEETMGKNKYVRCKFYQLGKDRLSDCLLFLFFL